MTLSSLSSSPSTDLSGRLNYPTISFRSFQARTLQLDCNRGELTTYFGAKVRARLVSPVPVREMVHDAAAALFTGGFDGVFGGVPVVAEDVEGLHLVVDLVGASRLGADDFERLVFGILGLDGGLRGDDGDGGGGGSCFFGVRFEAEDLDEVVVLFLGGVVGGCCDGTGREEDEQEVGEEHFCGIWGWVDGDCGGGR